MKIKTSELQGAALDWAVNQIEECCDDPYTPLFSTNWAQGGPIIEREKIRVAPNLNGTWLGQIRHTEAHPLVMREVLAGWTNKHGFTPLIAAMRCYVASKLGDEIEVPEALK